MTREEMMDSIITKFGFEAVETIKFCRLCEQCRDECKIKAKYTECMGKEL